MSNLTNIDKKKVLKNKTDNIKKSDTVKTLKTKEKNKAISGSASSQKNNLKPVKTLTKKKSEIIIQTDNKKINDKNLPDTIKDELIDQAALERGDVPMTIVEHLEELRSRIIIIITSFFILACIAFYFSDQLVYFINKPFLESGNKVNIFSLTGGFMFKMKISIAIAILLLIPLITFHVWRFISPAIEKPERFSPRFTISSAIILFYAGVCFVFLILPSTIKVLLGFVNKSMVITNGADDYLHFIFFMSFIMGFICELPVIIFVLTKIGLVTPQFLIRKRKYAIIIIWITAAIVTPAPDILSQSLVGIPLMFLYEISIVISKIVLIRKKRKELKLNYKV